MIKKTIAAVRGAFIKIEREVIFPGSSLFGRSLKMIRFIHRTSAHDIQKADDVSGIICASPAPITQ